MQLYILRHGETECNKLGQWYCPITSPINETGIFQAKDIGRKLDKIKFDKIYLSPAKRCIQTAEYALGNSLDHRSTIENDLVERDLKGLRNLNTVEILEKYNIDLDKPTTSKIDHLGDIENSGKFHSRIRSTVERIISNGKKDENILLVTHGGVLFSFSEQFLNLEPKRSTFENCAFLGLNIDENGFSPFLSINVRQDWYQEVNPSWSSLRL